MADQSVAKAASGGFSVTPNYRRYVLGILVTVYTFNYLDRQILAILLEDIKAEFLLSDSQLGFLTGFSFALFYATLGVPIAMLADRTNRKRVVAVALLIWSGMTALCGTATSYLQLVLFRIGVGVGEAGGSPPSYSLISDYYGPEERSTALAIYSLGVPFGILFGFLIGGQMSEWLGWRAAFFVVGIPGVLLAAILWFTVKEPPRGLSENKTEEPADVPPFWDVVKFIFTQKSLIHVMLGATLTSFVGYGFVAWAPAFYIRTHGMSVSEVSVFLALTIGIAGGIGTFGGGWLADKLSARDTRWRMWVVAVALLVTSPFGFVVYLADDLTMSQLFFIAPAFIGSLFLGPSLGVVQGMVSVRMRAVAGAFFLFILNFIALGGGPFFVGLVSDLLADSAGTDSLRYALAIAGVFNLWAAFHYWYGARHLAADAKRLQDQ